MNDLSLHIIDIIQNSLAAEATQIKLSVEENLIDDYLIIKVKDNGRGMSSEVVKQLEDPFYTTRTTRRVGMGIPLLKHSAIMSDGDLTIKSTLGVGTEISALFVHSHIDRPPLGDVANSFMLMVTANPGIYFIFEYIYNDKVYLFDSHEVAEALDGMSLSDVRLFKMLEEMVKENMRGLVE